MIIDGHAHACGEFADVEQLIELLDKRGVDKVALCPGVKNNTSTPRPPDIRISGIKHHPVYWRYFINPYLRFTYQFVFKDQGDGNEFVHSFAQAHPDRIIQIYWLDPRASDFMKKLENDLKEWNIKGIKLHQACTPFKNDSPEMNQIAEFAGEKQLPLFIHLWSKKESRKLVVLANSYPETDFILLHLIGVEIVAKYAQNLTNIYYEISPYSYISEKRIKYAVETLGADHIIFGSDTPFDRDALRSNMERLENMDLSDVQKEQILGENIAKILNL
jgi:predicted TIM-barrel fold metal-dependent hydrolase